jgi:glucose/arabinose dehydrogenase
MFLFTNMITISQLSFFITRQLKMFITHFLIAATPKVLSLVLLASVLAGRLSVAQAQAPRSPSPEPVKGVVDVQTIAKGLEHPWSLAFLPGRADARH